MPPVRLVPTLFGASLGLFLAAACAPGSSSSTEAPPLSPAALPPSSAAAPTASSSAGPTASSAPSSAPSASAPPPAPSAPPKVTFPKTPKPIEPKHGGSYWTVFVVLGPDSPATKSLADAWGATKLPLVRGQGCHQGKGAPGDDETFVGLYFKTEAQAKAFADGAQPAVARVAELKVFCLD